MIKGKTFDYLVNVFGGLLLKRYPKFKEHGYGIRDKYENKGKIAHLCGLFCEVMYQMEPHYILVDEGKRLYAYNGEYYDSVGGLDFLNELVKRVMQSIKIGSIYQLYASKIIAKECYTGILHNESCIYRPDRRYICFSNGVFDLHQGKLLGFDITRCTDIALDIAYNANASNLTWDIKVKEIIPNKDMLSAFQMFCGTFLIERKELKVEYICYLIGSGSNGKSVVASSIAGVFGEDYFSRFTPYDLFKASDSKVNMAALEGKIGNLTDDLENKDISGGAFKRFISGEKFQARRLYGNPFLVQAPVMLCCTNSMPESSDDTWGHHRRQLPILTTKVQFGKDKEQDPYLSAKLQTDEARQRIFNWIYEGYRKILRNNGTIELPEYVKDVQEQLMMDSSSSRRWFRDMGYAARIPESSKDEGWKPLKYWYEDYCRYAKEGGYVDMKKRNDISSMLRSLGCKEERRCDGIYFCVGKQQITEGYED